MDEKMLTVLISGSAVGGLMVLNKILKTLGYPKQNGKSNGYVHIAPDDHVVGIMERISTAMIQNVNNTTQLVKIAEENQKLTYSLSTALGTAMERQKGTMKDLETIKKKLNLD